MYDPALGVTVGVPGGVVSILLTVAVTDPVFPTESINWNVNDPLLVKVYVSRPPLLVTVTDLSGVIVAVTDPFVGVVIL